MQGGDEGLCLNHIRVSHSTLHILLGLLCELCSHDACHGRMRARSSQPINRARSSQSINYKYKGRRVGFDDIARITAMAIASRIFIDYLQTIARLKAEVKGFRMVYFL